MYNRTHASLYIKFIQDNVQRDNVTNDQDLRNNPTEAAIVL